MLLVQGVHEPGQVRNRGDAELGLGGSAGCANRTSASASPSAMPWIVRAVNPATRPVLPDTWGRSRAAPAPGSRASAAGRRECSAIATGRNAAHTHGVHLCGGAPNDSALVAGGSGCGAAGAVRTSGCP
jgi:hypothetical protein